MTKSPLKLAARNAVLTTLIMASALVPQLLHGETVTTTVPVGMAPRYIAVNPVTNKIYVVNYGDRYYGDPPILVPPSVTIINSASTPPTTTSVPVGTYPVAIALNSESNKVYVVSNEEAGYGTVTVIDGATDTVCATVSVMGYSPSAIAVNSNPLVNKVYVSNSINNTVTVIDGATDTVRGLPVPVGTNPGAIAVNTVTNKVYVVSQENQGIGTATVINGSTDTVIGLPVPVGTYPVAIAANPLTNKVYVANFYDNTVTVIDGTTDSVSGLPVPVGTYPGVIELNTVTNKVYVASQESQGNGTVTVINGSTDTVSALPVPVGTIPYAVAVNPNTNKVYVANRGSDNITVIDGATNTPTTLAAVITDPPLPWDAPRAIAVNLETNKVYVANELSNDVTVIQNFYTVSVNRTGIGNGTITSSPAGINCGSICSAAFPEGPAVVMYQRPDNNSGFSGWGGACSGNWDCAFNIFTDKAVSAGFILSPLVQNLTTGVAYNALQDAYNEAQDNHVIRARSALPSTGLNLNKTITLTIEGGYDADFSSCIGLTAVSGRVNVRLAPLHVHGLAIRPSP